MTEGKSIRTLAVGAAVSLALAVGFTGVYFLVWRGPQKVAEEAAKGAITAAGAGYELFKRAGKDIYRALQFEPRVTVGSRTVHEPARTITELSTASSEFTHRHAYEATWAGSTKRFELEGDFLAKAGFPIDDSFQIALSEDGRTMTLRHPPPRVLSCELIRVRVIADEDGWWNKIQPEEREAVQNELIREARGAAVRPDLLEKATERLGERLAPLAEKHAFEFRKEILP